MLTRVWLVTTICFASIRPNAIAQQLVIEKQLLSARDSTPVPYAMVLDISSNKHGTTSDKDGFFSLTLPGGSENHLLYISSLGFKPLKESVAHLLARGKSIYVEEAPYDLGEVTVKARAETEIKSFGSTDIPVIPENMTNAAEALSFLNPGRGFGVFVVPGKGARGYLHSIEYYIENRGHPDTPLAVRLLLPTVQMKNGKLEPLANFTDMLKDTLTLKPQQPGWNEINLEDMAVGLPKKPFLLILYPLSDDRDRYWADSKGNRFFGSVIGTYGTDEIEGLYASRQIQGYRYAYLRPFGANTFRIPAIVVNWVKTR